MNASEVNVNMNTVKDLNSRVEELMNAAARLAACADEIKEHTQALCDHDFADPIKGYEHEGGHCKVCGVNQLYAPTLMKQWMAKAEKVGQIETWQRVAPIARPAKVRSLKGEPVMDTSAPLIKQLRD